MLACALLGSMSACAEAAHEAPSAVGQLARVLGHDLSEVKVQGMLTRLDPEVEPATKATNWLEKMTELKEPAQNVCKVVAKVLIEQRGDEISVPLKQELFEATSGINDKVSIAILNGQLKLALENPRLLPDSSAGDSNIMNNIVDLANGVC